jgi:hypothetical protein
MTHSCCANLLRERFRLFRRRAVMPEVTAQANDSRDAATLPYV